MYKKKLRGIPKWPKTKFELQLERLPRIIKREAKRGIRWLFFYEYEDNMDAFLHVCDVLALGFIAWRLFTL